MSNILIGTAGYITGSYTGLAGVFGGEILARITKVSKPLLSLLGMSVVNSALSMSLSGPVFSTFSTGINLGAISLALTINPYPNLSDKDKSITTFKGFFVGSIIYSTCFAACELNSADNVLKHLIPTTIAVLTSYSASQSHQRRISHLRKRKTSVTQKRVNIKPVNDSR